MNRAIVVLILVTFIALSLWVKKSFFSPPQSRITAITEASPALGSASGGKSVIERNTQPESGARPNQFQEARASLDQMSLILKDAVSGSKSLDHLIQKLRSSGQNPEMTRQDNGVTGEMTIVRTQNPPPGTRYFHAQYFKQQDNQRYVQHISFEFRPAPQAMNEAVRSITQNFSLGAPSESRDGFVQWELEDNYVLWIKRKALPDLKDDPFKAYDPEKDIGTVQVTVEQKIHDNDGDEHGH